MLDKLRILQTNLRKSYTHTEQLKIKLDKLRANIICIQEPYAYKPKNEPTYAMSSYGREFKLIYKRSDKPPKAAIAIRTNIDCLVDQCLTDENKAVVILQDRQC